MPDLTNPFAKVKPTLDMEDKFPFGKYRGETVESVLDDDPQYILWWDENVTQYNIRKSIVRSAM